MEVAAVALLALGGAVGAAALEATSGFQANSGSPGDSSEEEDSFSPSMRGRSISPSNFEVVGESGTSPVADASDDAGGNGVTAVEGNRTACQAEHSGEGREFFHIPQVQSFAFSGFSAGAISPSSAVSTTRRLNVRPNSRFTEKPGHFVETNRNVSQPVEGRPNDVPAPLFWARLRSCAFPRPLGCAPSDIHRPDFLPASPVFAGGGRGTVDASDRNVGPSSGVAAEGGAASNVAWRESLSGKSDGRCGTFSRSEQGRQDFSTQGGSRARRGASLLFRAFTKFSGPLRRGESVRTPGSAEFATCAGDEPRRQSGDVTQNVVSTSAALSRFSFSHGGPSTGKVKTDHRSAVEFPCSTSGREGRYLGPETEARMVAGSAILSRETTETSTCGEEASSRSTTTTVASDRGESSTSAVTRRSSLLGPSEGLCTTDFRCRGGSSAGLSKSASSPLVDEAVTSGARKRRMLSSSACSLSRKHEEMDDWMNSPHPKRRRSLSEAPQMPDLSGVVSRFSSTREDHARMGALLQQSGASWGSLTCEAESALVSRVRVNRGVAPRRLADLSKNSDEQNSDRDGRRRRENGSETQTSVAPTSTAAGGASNLELTGEGSYRRSLGTNLRQSKSQSPDISAPFAPKGNDGALADDVEASATLPPVASTSVKLGIEGRGQKQEEKGERAGPTEHGDVLGELKRRSEAMEGDRLEFACASSQTSHAPSDSRERRETLKKRVSLLGRRVLPPWPAVLEAKQGVVEKATGKPREAEQESREERWEKHPTKAPEQADRGPLSDRSPGHSGGPSPLRHADPTAAESGQWRESRKRQPEASEHGVLPVRSGHPVSGGGSPHREGKIACTSAKEHGDRDVVEQVGQKNSTAGASRGGPARREERSEVSPKQENQATGKLEDSSLPDQGERLATDERATAHFSAETEIQSVSKSQKPSSSSSKQTRLGHSSLPRRPVEGSQQETSSEEAAAERAVTPAPDSRGDAVCPEAGKDECSEGGERDIKRRRVV
ncbi:hypothetical protein TGARI_276220 [Toxoplasma gondii ARI]|uniref:Transmembrane protein n=1 Tax=Toxoplasma gondii ARI TaxID=1074872 RepID=A0A139XJ70_TOXGO|nr:hypothetical protein TGARI_276220 [Toxoplasma gondii ARI]